jgi:tetratricopeptide (TPR) repeat protein
VALDGVVVRAEPDPLTQLEIYDADELFHIAREMERNGRVEDAITVYDSLLQDFPQSAVAEPAEYNLGLLHERREEFEAAANAYFVIVDQAAPAEAERRRTWLDAHYRIAVCFSRLQAWWRAVAMFDEVLEQPWIEPSDRIEADLGRGIAMQEAGEPASAEIAFAAVLRIAREESSRGPFIDNGMVAEAAFRMGEISAERYRAVKLEFPLDVLTERLELKCQELLNAQHRFLRAIRHGDAHTVAAAGFRIGSLYESLYDTIVGLKVPDELTEAQAELYREEVRKRVNVLVEKALRIYERALVVGQSAPTAKDWNERLRASIERLRDIYLSTPGVA